MKAESEELLSLLVDGEQVDPEALAAALAEPGAAETLVEYARVHRAVQDTDARPSDQFYDKMRRELAAAPRGIRLQADFTRHAMRWRAPLAAAALVLLSVLGGMWVGRSMPPAGTVPIPVTVRTPVTPPSETGSHIRVLMPADCPAPGPPKPDRIVELVPAPAANPRPGVSAGGNRP